MDRREGVERPRDLGRILATEGDAAALPVVIFKPDRNWGAVIVHDLDHVPVRRLDLFAAHVRALQLEGGTERVGNRCACFRACRDRCSVPSFPTLPGC